MPPSLHRATHLGQRENVQSGRIVWQTQRQRHIDVNAMTTPDFGGPAPLSETATPEDGGNLEVIAVVVASVRKAAGPIIRQSFVSVSYAC